MHLHNELTPYCDVLRAIQSALSPPTLRIISGRKMESYGMTSWIA